MALLTTADAHGVAIGEKVEIDINPSDVASTTTWYVRKRIYQEAVLKNPVISTTLNDSGVDSYTTMNGGNDYTAGTYTNVSLVGGTGSGAEATLVVSSSGTVNSITITDRGTGYSTNDTLTVLSKAGTPTATNNPLGKDLSKTSSKLQIFVNHAGFSIESTTLRVANADKITVNDFLQIGSEIVKVTAKSSISLTVTRGQKSTTKVNHFNGATAVSYTHLTLPTKA